MLFAPLLGAKTLSGRYIVELNTEPVAEHVARLSRRPALHGAAATAHRTRLRAEQQTLRTQIELRQAKVLDTVDTVANAMFVQIPDEQAAQLASLHVGRRRVSELPPARVLPEPSSPPERVDPVGPRFPRLTDPAPRLYGRSL